MKKKYQSKILKVIHENAAGMHRLGIMNDAEMREFDEDCLVHEPEPAYVPSNSGRTGHVKISAKGGTFD